MSILTIIIILLVISMICDHSAAKANKLAEYRQQEMMDFEKELHKDLKTDLSEIKSNQEKIAKQDRKFINRKRYIKDKFGNIIAEEILVTNKTEDL